jgi:hypothetical protein
MSTNELIERAAGPCECPYQDGKGDTNWHADGCPAEAYARAYLDSYDWDDCLICPYCGHKDGYGEACDLDLEYDGDKVDAPCGTCGRDFRVTLCVTYEWRTDPVMGEWKDGYHQWKLPLLEGDHPPHCRICGIVRRADGQNKPCPGKVNVALRGGEV